MSDGGAPRPSIPIQTRAEAMASLAAHDALLEARKAEKKVNAIATIYEESSIEDLRRMRLAELAARSKSLQQWRADGHGQVQDIPDEKAWFAATRNSDRVITHFYRPSNTFCEVIDSHLIALANRHIETKIVKINAEKSPYLTNRLHVETLPTLVMHKKGSMVDQLVGFNGVAGLDKCTFGDFERRLARSGIIDFEGDPAKPSSSTKKMAINVIRKSHLSKTSIDEDRNDSDSD